MTEHSRPLLASGLFLAMGVCMKKMILLGSLLLAACAIKDAPPPTLNDEERLAKDIHAAAYVGCFEQRVELGQSIEAAGKHCECLADKLAENPANHEYFFAPPRGNEAIVKQLTEAAEDYCDPIFAYYKKLSSKQRPHYLSTARSCMDGIRDFYKTIFDVEAYCACISHGFITSLPSVNYLTDPTPKQQEEADKIYDNAVKACKDSAKRRN
jgi:hypothetical protein